MLTVERMIILEDEHRNLGRWLILRFDNNVDPRCGRCFGVAPCAAHVDQLSATHGMAGGKVSAGGVNAHGIARQNRDVVMLGWIQNNLTRIDWGLVGAST